MSFIFKGIKRPDTYTPLDALRDSLMQAMKASDGIEAPSVILWTDPERHWQSIIPRLNGFLPLIYTLGDFEPKSKTGPAIWIRCELDLTNGQTSTGFRHTPILYLPGIGKQDLRAGEDSPFALKPLVELQYRGKLWNQLNGRDWTIEAFFTSKEDGLGIEISKDSKTKEAMLRSLANLVDIPFQILKQKQWDADDFDSLVVRDKEGSFLLWMNDPEAFRKSQTPQQWETFCDLAKNHFKFDPATSGVEEATQKILSSDGIWESVWNRFQLAPLHYMGIVSALKETPGVLIGVEEDRLPSLNRNLEQQLRTALAALLQKPVHEIVDGLKSLDKEHAHRRNWVWAKIGDSSLCLILERILQLVDCTSPQVPTTNLENIIAYYVESGHLCDRAAMNVLKADLSIDDALLVSKILNIIYGDWLDKSARALQGIVQNDLAAAISYIEPTNAVSDCCYLFVDGFRYDLASEFSELLSNNGYAVKLSHRLAPFPSVTASAKAYSAPGVGPALSGTETGELFNPVFKVDDEPVSAAGIRSFLSKNGYEYFEGDEIRSPQIGKAGAWIETGKVDELGHKLGGKLVKHLDDEIESLMDRVSKLFQHGWTKIRIVTDHGWLLLPGGLPKIDLPPSVSVTKWSRCAVVQGDSRVNVPTVPWTFNSHVRIAVPWGIACFRSSNEYAHGGISLQECIVPEIEIQRELKSESAKIVSATWRGMRCKVIISGDCNGVLVDLRTKWKLSASSILTEAKKPNENLEVSIVVPDDAHEGSAATLVLINAAGEVLHKYDTTVGGD